jgi:hypothetical protein
MPTTPTPSSSCVLLLHLHELHYCAFAATQADKQKAAWLPLWPHTTDKHDDLNVTTTGVQKQISGCDLPMGTSNSLSSFIHSIILSFQRMKLLRHFLHSFDRSFHSKRSWASFFIRSFIRSFILSFIHSKRSCASFFIHPSHHSFIPKDDPPAPLSSSNSSVHSFISKDPPVPLSSYIRSFQKISCLFRHSFIHSFIPKDPVPPLSSFIHSFIHS